MLPVTYIPFYVTMIKTKINTLRRKDGENWRKNEKSNNNGSHLTASSSNVESTGAILTTKGMQSTPVPETQATQRLAYKINNHVRDAVESTIVMGNFLIMAKEHLPNSGEWQKRLRNKVEISEDLAESYMNLARIYPDPKSLSTSEMSKAFELITYTC